MAWLRNVSEDEIRLSAITIQEIRTGAESMPSGQKRGAVEAWLEEDLLRGFANRILAVDAAVADLCGRVIVETIGHGHVPSLSDALIASTARVHGLQVATLNRKHFEKNSTETTRIDRELLPDACERTNYHEKKNCVKRKC